LHSEGGNHIDGLARVIDEHALAWLVVTMIEVRS